MSMEIYLYGRDIEKAAEFSILKSINQFVIIIGSEGPLEDIISRHSYEGGAATLEIEGIVPGNVPMVITRGQMMEVILAVRRQYNIEGTPREFGARIKVNNQILGKVFLTFMFEEGNQGV